MSFAASPHEKGSEGTFVWEYDTFVTGNNRGESVNWFNWKQPAKLAGAGGYSHRPREPVAVNMAPERRGRIRRETVSTGGGKTND